MASVPASKQSVATATATKTAEDKEIEKLLAQMP